MASIKGRYARIEIPLDKVESGKELFLTGDYLCVISFTGSGSCEIKLDHRHSQTINLREITSISGFFQRIYLTTDGSGGVCSIYIGTGMAMHVVSDPQKLRNAESIATQITAIDTVTCLATVSLKLNDVSILNSNGIYSCYVGPYNADVAAFKAYSYVLLPHQVLKFAVIDMYTLGTVRYDANNVILDILGTYE